MTYHLAINIPDTDTDRIIDAEFKRYEIEADDMEAASKQADEIIEGLVNECQWKEWRGTEWDITKHPDKDVEWGYTVTFVFTEEPDIWTGFRCYLSNWPF